MDSINYLNIIKKGFIGIAICILLIFLCKLTIFYIPFLIAYIISLIIDPIIKWVNKRTGLSRKTSSIIVMVTIFGIIIALIVWGTINFISEATNLLSGLNTYLEKTISFINQNITKINFRELIPEEVINILENSTTEYLNMITGYFKEFLTKILNYITSIPNMFINIIITILATYFITSDKFYILDRMEYHFPKK